ncbi:MAG: Gfo/Idh/MocA family oxidoreductase [Phycisphaerae bacterium]|nr:Gfo/Idh/MocA family oxidoreductase [Phycisphaerae bacterium]
MAKCGCRCRQKVRVGIIGPGGVGADRAQKLNAEPNCEVVAACDVDEKRIEDLRKRCGKKDIKAYLGPNGYKEMIKREDLQAVGVFGPHSLHHAHAKLALEHDCHILIEKPMANGVAKAVELYKLARKKKRVLLIHYQRHFEPVYVTARRLLSKGIIGKLRHFYCYMAQDYRIVGGWRLVNKISGGGQINDSGSHYQDIMIWMTGLMPLRACGATDKYMDGKLHDIELNSSHHVWFEKGLTGRIVIMGDYLDGFVDDVIIEGDKGTLKLTGGKIVLRKDGRVRELPMDVPKDWPKDPCNNFAGLLDGRYKENCVDGILGARVSMLTETLLESGRTRKTVECKDILARDGLTYRDIR